MTVPDVFALLRTALLHLLPHHALSRLVHRATRSRLRLWKNWLIRTLVRRFRIDVSDADQADPTGYPTFNAFFTRALKPGARPLPADPLAIACPVDGRVSQAGVICADSLVQAKGRDYPLSMLLGDDTELARTFEGGQFATLYLAPSNYHRIHMPVAGRLRETRYVPGRLFPVNAHAVQHVDAVFARNERVVALFDTDAGPMALVLVGALFVGSIETVWAGEITPGPARGQPRRWAPLEPVTLARGEEMGRFNMGSTVIVLFGPQAVQGLDALVPERRVRMGESLGVTTQARGV